MATQISDIGKSAAIEALFKESGFSNEIRTAFRAEGEVGAVQRLFIENIDFDLTYHPMKHLGYKLSLCIMGELYSLFREPETLLFTVGLSNRFSFEDVKELWKGVTAAAKEHSVHHIGLDLVPSPSGMIIACTGYGVRDTKSVSDRTEPSATDLLILSGNVGAAYMGMHVLEREKVAFVKTPNGVLPPQPDLTGYKYILEQYLAPSLPTGVLNRFREAGITPTAGVFVTRGLGAAVKEISSISGKGAKIYIDRIPIAAETFRMAQELNIDPVTSAINGGDDYRLLYSIPLSQHEICARELSDFDIIGHLAKPETGTVIVTGQGAEIEIKAQGF